MKVQIIKTRMRVRIKMRILGKSRKWEELEVGRVGSGKSWLWENFTKENPKVSGTNFLSIFTNICKTLVVEKTKKGRPESMPKMCASCWRTAISRKFSHKKWEKVLKVSRRLPPASTINDLMSTNPAKEAITILNKRSTGHLVRSREFISVRDFLIVRLELENV